ncbi:membrane fusion protein, multidrug efflux system [Janthinobacterium sp. CG_23.3]|uniref:efflux RND transporter periplasmic adaptor subunit n=1 Tax=unclassified Janthinobacterium TaxID=2610881 RepID=UPI000346518E|nr:MULTISPECIES: efflux RND transporter periplasmic adaptor subunit [unclassified Janthinobacterium]MEC5160911.1 membrane fusion protein (multidrug efflux system) [Janthinobacterium sp. CG_S6]
MKKLVYSGLVLTVLALGAGFANSKYLNAGIKVKTVAVERGAITTFVSAPGNVINREELTVNTPVAAQLLKVHVAEGDKVEKGQVLAEFDDRENAIQIGMARATLTFAEQTQVEARGALLRIRQIFEVGGESRNAVEAAQQRVQGAQKDIELAKAELQKIQLQRSQLQIVAPRAGVITASQARAGVWSKPGDSLFKLAPDGVREIEIRLDAADGAAATPGKSVAVTSDAFADRGWNEKVTWVAPVTNKDSMANSLSVRISLGADAPALVLGQQVDVKISTATRGQILKIPSGAITLMQGKPMAAVVENDSVHFVPIEVGIGDITHTEVVRGLSAGQRIILAQGKPLKEGDKLHLDAERERQ